MNKFAELISKSMPSDCHLNSDGNWNGINKKYVGGHVIPLFADKREDHLFVEAFPKLQTILETNGLDFNFKNLYVCHAVWGMGQSLFCYSYPIGTSGDKVVETEKKSYHNYLDFSYLKHDIPDAVKAAILDILQNCISHVNSCVGYDSEGGSYNSLTFK